MIGATLTAPNLYYGTTMNNSNGTPSDPSNPTWNADLGSHGSISLNGATVNGTTSPNAWADTLPPIQYPDTSSWATPSGLPPGSSIDGSGNMTLSGTWMCPAVGMKYKVETLTVTSTGILQLQDRCEFYIANAGDTALLVQSGGQIRTVTNNKFWIKGSLFSRQAGSTTGGIFPVAPLLAVRKPSDLQIYIGRNSMDVAARSEIMQVPQIRAVIYAPNSKLFVEGYSAVPTFADLTFYGAIVAALIDINVDNSKKFMFHYDESLKGLRLDGSGTATPTCSQSPNFNCYRVKSWQITQ